MWRQVGPSCAQEYLCGEKNFNACEFKSCMNVNVCLCKTLKQVIKFIPQSTCQSVNHAHSSHIATPLSFYDDICPQKFRVAADLISCSLGYSYNTPCSHVRNSGTPSLLCSFCALFNLSASFHHSFEW